MVATPTRSPDVTLHIVQPYENANIASVKQSFVFGFRDAVATAHAPTLNGIPIKPYTNGGFLA